MQWRNAVKIKLENKSVTIHYLESDNDEFGICFKRLLSPDELKEAGEKEPVAAISKMEKEKVLKTNIKLSKDAAEALYYSLGLALTRLEKTKS